jgi:hypothetical protein
LSYSGGLSPFSLSHNHVSQAKFASCNSAQ